MKKDLLELIFILDASGSMHSLKEDTIGGFNSLLEKQRKENEGCYITTILFNSSAKIVHDRVKIEYVKDLTENDYVPKGFTALLDTVGNAIKHIEHIHRYASEEDKPDKTIFIINTDGLENDSEKYSKEQIKELITDKTENFGWEFVFLGVGIDAYSEASTLGISSNNWFEFSHDSEGISEEYDLLHDVISILKKNSGRL